MHYISIQQPSNQLDSKFLLNISVLDFYSLHNKHVPKHQLLIKGSIPLDLECPDWLSQQG